MAFKVFDLQCEHGHVFEGWFASHEDYHAQRERNLVSCPLCQSHAVERLLSAPRLNVSGGRPAPEPAPAPGAANVHAAQAEALRALRQLLRQVDNVGGRFAEEARRMHAGDAPARPIRGIASGEERQALLREGIEVAAIPAVLDDEHLQ